MGGWKGQAAALGLPPPGRTGYAPRAAAAQGSFPRVGPHRSQIPAFAPQTNALLPTQTRAAVSHVAPAPLRAPRGRSLGSGLWDRSLFSCSLLSRCSSRLSSPSWPDKDQSDALALAWSRTIGASQGSSEGPAGQSLMNAAGCGSCSTSGGGKTLDMARSTMPWHSSA